jgi:hypothetical protein
LGIELTNILGEGFQDLNPSIDRIDNTKPYQRDNIEIISVLANKMKHTASLDLLIAFARGVLAKHDNQL